MEIVLYIIAGFIGLAGLFMLIEYPYYLISVFIFLIHYDYNLELPGPLDLRGWLTILLFLRLIIFDRENLDLLRYQLLKNKLFIIIVLMSVYFIAVTYSNTNMYRGITKLVTLNIIGLALGFLVILRGYTKQVFFVAIVAVGVLSSADLMYTQATKSQLQVTRILDVISKTNFLVDLNHNASAANVAVAFLVTLSYTISKSIKRIISLPLLIFLSIGLLISTSRGTLLAVLIILIVTAIVYPKAHFEIKKIFMSGFKIAFFLFLIFGSYLLVLSNMGLSSTFKDQIYYRLVEEPLAIIQGKPKGFVYGGKEKKGSIDFREQKYAEDISTFSKLPMKTQVFGYGDKGYFKVATVKYDKHNLAYQMSAHNGYIKILTERGIIGIVFLIIVYGYLLIISLKAFRRDISVFPFFAFVLFFMIGTHSIMLEKFAFIIFGGIIGQYLLYLKSFEEEESFDDNIMENSSISIQNNIK